MALLNAPGVRAVQVEYPSGRTVIGTQHGQPLPKQEILRELESIGYRGEFSVEGQTP